MKLFFISDIHLDLRSNKEWEAQRFLKLFKDLGDTACDLLVLGGDIFERARPSIEEIRLFYQGLDLLNLPPDKVIIINGNHEEVKKPLYTFDYLPSTKFTYVKTSIIETEKTNLFFVSHSDLGGLDEVLQDITKKQSILFTHVRPTIPPHILEEIPLLKVAKGFDLVISGDIHFKWDAFDNFMYPGTPYSHSFKTEIDHGYFMIDTDTLEIEYIKTYYANKVKLTIPYRDLHKLKTLSPDNIYKVVVSGTVEELEGLSSHDNIIYEKHIVTTEVDELTEEDIVDITDKDVVRNLLNYTQKTYELSPEVMEEGERIIDGLFR